MNAEREGNASTELALHELGEALATAVATMHQELARYSHAGGAYILDDVELTLPLAVRTEFMARTIAISLGFGATVAPTESSRSCGAMPFAPARALTTSAKPSMSTTTLRMRLFSDIRGVGAGG